MAVLMRAVQSQLILLILLAGCGQSEKVPQLTTQPHEFQSEQQVANESGARLTGQPYWIPLGEEVYHRSDIEKAQQSTLSFVNQPRWFLTDVRFPKRFQDLPTDVEGSRLEFDVSQSDDPSALLLTITLTSTERAVRQQFEHRWNNILPILFAFYIDGDAIRDIDKKSFSKFGGSIWHEVLIKSGESKTWNIRVNAESILDLIPDHHAHKLSIVAVFSEYQHEGGLIDGIHQLAHAYSETTDDDEKFVPPIVVRSEPANIIWDGEKWTVPAKP